MGGVDDRTNIFLKLKSRLCLLIHNLIIINMSSVWEFHINSHNIENLPKAKCYVLNVIDPARIDEAKLPASIDYLEVRNQRVLPTLAALLKRVQVNVLDLSKLTFVQEGETSSTDDSLSDGSESYNESDVEASHDSWPEHRDTITPSEVLQMIDDLANHPAIPPRSIKIGAAIHRTIYPSENVTITSRDGNFTIDYPETARGVHITISDDSQIEFPSARFPYNALTALRSLTLKNVCLSANTPAFDMPLEELSLINVKLKGTSIAAKFTQLHNLVKLELKYIKLKSTIDLPQLKKLESLVVESDTTRNITMIINKYARRQPQLKHLDVRCEANKGSLSFNFLRTLTGLETLKIALQTNAVLCPPYQIRQLTVIQLAIRADITLVLKNCTRLEKLKVNSDDIVIDVLPDSLTTLKWISMDVPREIPNVQTLYLNFTVYGDLLPLPKGYIPDSVEKLYIANMIVPSIPQRVKYLRLESCELETADPLPDTLVEFISVENDFVDNTVPPLPRALDRLILENANHKVARWPDQVKELYISAMPPKDIPPNLVANAYEMSYIGKFDPDTTILSPNLGEVSFIRPARYYDDYDRYNIYHGDKLDALFAQQIQHNKGKNNN